MADNLNVIKYYGSKAVIGNMLKEHFNYNTKVYIEMFGGGASILLNKPVHHAEIYNEIDKGIYTLFKVLKDSEGSHILQEQLLKTQCGINVFNESLYIREKYIKNKPYDRVISDMDRYIKVIEKKYGYDLYKAFKKCGDKPEDIGSKIYSIEINHEEYKEAVKKMEAYNTAVSQYIPEKDICLVKSTTLYITRKIQGVDKALDFEKQLNNMTTVSAIAVCTDKLVLLQEEISEKMCSTNYKKGQAVYRDMAAMVTNAVCMAYQMFCKLPEPVNEEKIHEGSPGTVSMEEIKLAKATFITFNMSRYGMGKSFSPEKKLWEGFRKKVEKIPYIEQRLSNVTITNHDCFEALKDIKKTFNLGQYEDEEIFIYFDPPYLKEAGSINKDDRYTPGMVYSHGFKKEDHARFLGLVQKLPFKMAVSNYRDKENVYDGYLNKENRWRSLEFDAYTTIGGKKADRKEVLWMNY